MVTLSVVAAPRITINRAIAGVLRWNLFISKAGRIKGGEIEVGKIKQQVKRIVSIISIRKNIIFLN